MYISLKILLKIDCEQQTDENQTIGNPVYTSDDIAGSRNLSNFFCEVKHLPGESLGTHGSKSVDFVCVQTPFTNSDTNAIMEYH